MRVLKKVTTAQVEHTPWQQQLWPFLRNYRATPHTTTGKAPAEVLYGRNIKTQLPQFDMPDAQSHPIQDQIIRSKDTQEKTNMKRYADKQRHTTHSQIDVGDTVLVKNQTKGKLQPVYIPQPYTVIIRNGSMVTATREGHQITRNVSHFKKIATKERIQEEKLAEKEHIQEEKKSEKEKEGRERGKRARKQPTYLDDYELEQ